MRVREEGSDLEFVSLAWMGREREGVKNRKKKEERNIERERI